jgi:hypothetical protein
MPYMIRRVVGSKRPYKIIKKATGKVVGTSMTMAAARASIRARYMNG